jgi:PAS domain S-box-containing protein
VNQAVVILKVWWASLLARQGTILLARRGNLQETPLEFLLSNVEGKGRKNRLLIVEDESLIALDLKLRLVRAGHDVVGVADCLHDALDLFSTHQPDLVLMDVHVKGDTDGIEIAHAMGKLSDVPVIFLTAYADADTIKRAAETSPYGYLLKPFDDRTLTATITVALERHAADTRARLLSRAVERATLGIVLIETRGTERRSVYCNDAFCDLAAGTSTEVLQLEPLFLYPAGLQAENRHLDEALTRRLPFEITLRGRRLNGREFWSAVTLSPVPDRNGNISHMLAFHVDITRQREAEDGLARSQRLELMGRLSAGIAHDFNNILSAIMGFSDLAIWAAAGERHKDHMEGVAHAAERGAMLTRKLLELSRSSTSPKRGFADLLQVVQLNYRMIQRLAGPHIKVSLELDSEPMWVGLDTTSLEQIVLNLVANARDAMPNGGKVSIAVRRPDEPAGAFQPRQYVRLTVGDTGAGMDGDTIERLFEPFFTAKALGTGLGLTTCRMLVEQASGAIRVQSEVGQGTQISVDFPLVDAQVPAPLETPALLPSHVRGNAGGAVCLLVEEDTLLRRSSMQALIHVGFNVIAVASGEAACREMSTLGDKLALLICDMTLSGMSASAVFAQAREATPLAELIATSGNFNHSTDDCGPRVALLWKPFAANTLARWALDALGPHRQLPLIDRTEPFSLKEPEVTTSADEKTALRVLLVDDDDQVRSALAALLQTRQLNVIQATNCAEALTAAEAYEFQLAVIDVRLPDADGLDLLMKLRQLDPLLAVLVIAGESSVESAQRAMRGRAAGFLLKPIAPDFFMQEIDRTLRDAQLQRLQHNLLLARSEFQPLLHDLQATERRFAESLRGLYMVFQPLVRSHDRSVYAFEALMRSDGPMQNPAELLIAAEVLGRIEDLGRQVRSCVATQMSEHPDRFEPIFVNLHPLEFRADLLLREDEPLRPFASRIVWEVTERAELSLRDQVSATVEQLRAAGYRVAIDDLGEGYAGLSLLVSLSPDVAKLDMSLVRGLEGSHMKRALVSSLVSVCRRARTLVVAEGVETETEAALLIEIGCDLLQGYLFAHPGPPFPERIGN